MTRSGRLRWLVYDALRRGGSTADAVMVARVLVAGARHRPGYLLTVFVATAAATTALAAAGGLGARLHAALATGDALGVNLVVRPQPGGPPGLPLGEADRLRALPGVTGVAPWAELGELARPGGAPVPLLATSSAAAALHRGWELAGRWPRRGEAIAGATSGVALGTVVETPHGARRVSGVLRTGEAVDGALVLDVDSLGPVSIQRFEVRADPRRVESVASAAADAVAGAEATPLLRVTATRARLVTRLAWILGGAGALTALLALGTLAAASLSQLHARRRELALFFALGYTRAWVGRLLVAELLVVGALAWLLGAGAGELVAGLFARELLGAGATAGSPLGFQGNTHPGFPVGWGALAALAGAALVLAATARLTARRLAALEPAALLAGQ